MAARFPIDDLAWVKIASSGSPAVRMRTAGRIRLFVGAVAPALAAADYFTIEGEREPLYVGLLSGGQSLWARSDTGPATVEVIRSNLAVDQNSRLLSAAATVNSTLVKNTPGNVKRIMGRNNAAALRFLKLYDKATAPTVGTDGPVMTIALPAGNNFDISFPDPGYAFALGIGYGLTVNIADNDVTALTAADILALNVVYN